MDGCIATYEIDEHWEACESCVFCQRGTCFHGIKWADDSRIRDDGDGDYICTLYREGTPVEIEDELEKAKQTGLIIDAPGQKFLFDGIKPMTTRKAIGLVIEGVIDE